MDINNKNAMSDHSTALNQIYDEVKKKEYWKENG